MVQMHDISQGRTDGCDHGAEGIPRIEPTGEPDDAESIKSGSEGGGGNGSGYDHASER